MASRAAVAAYPPQVQPFQGGQQVPVRQPSFIGLPPIRRASTFGDSLIQENKDRFGLESPTGSKASPAPQGGPSQFAAPSASPPPQSANMISPRQPGHSQFVAGPYPPGQGPPHQQQPQLQYQHGQPYSHAPAPYGQAVPQQQPHQRQQPFSPHSFNHHHQPIHPGQPGQPGHHQHQQQQHYVAGGQGPAPGQVHQFAPAPGPGMTMQHGMGESQNMMGNPVQRFPPQGVWNLQESHLNEPLLPSSKYRPSPGQAQAQSQNQAHDNYAIDKETGLPIQPSENTRHPLERDGQGGQSAGPSTQHNIRNGEHEQHDGTGQPREEGKAARNSGLFNNIGNRFRPEDRSNSFGGSTHAGDGVSESSVATEDTRDKGRRQSKNLFQFRTNGSADHAGPQGSMLSHSASFDQRGQAAQLGQGQKEKKKFFGLGSASAAMKAIPGMSRVGSNGNLNQSGGVNGDGPQPGKPKKRFSGFTHQQNKNGGGAQVETLNAGAAHSGRPSFQGQNAGFASSPLGGPPVTGRQRSNTAGSRPYTADDQAGKFHTPISAIPEEDRANKASGAAGFLNGIFGNKSGSKSKEAKQQQQQQQQQQQNQPMQFPMQYPGQPQNQGGQAFGPRQMEMAGPQGSPQGMQFWGQQQQPPMQPGQQSMQVPAQLTPQQRQMLQMQMQMQMPMQQMSGALGPQQQQLLQQQQPPQPPPPQQQQQQQTPIQGGPAKQPIAQQAVASQHGPLEPQRSPAQPPPPASQQQAGFHHAGHDVAPASPQQSPQISGTPSSPVFQKHGEQGSVIESAPGSAIQPAQDHVSVQSSQNSPVAQTAQPQTVLRKPIAAYGEQASPKQGDRTSGRAPTVDSAQGERSQASPTPQGDGSLRPQASPSQGAGPLAGPVGLSANQVPPRQPSPSLSQRAGGSTEALRAVSPTPPPRALTPGGRVPPDGMLAQPGHTNKYGTAKLQSPPVAPPIQPVKLVSPPGQAAPAGPGPQQNLPSPWGMPRASPTQVPGGPLVTPQPGQQQPGPGSPPVNQPEHKSSISKFLGKANSFTNHEPAQDKPKKSSKGSKGFLSAFKRPKASEAKAPEASQPKQAQPVLGQQMQAQQMSMQQGRPVLVNQSLPQGQYQPQRSPTDGQQQTGQKPMPPIPQTSGGVFAPGAPQDASPRHMQPGQQYVEPQYAQVPIPRGYQPVHGEGQVVPTQYNVTRQPTGPFYAGQPPVARQGFPVQPMNQQVMAPPQQSSPGPQPGPQHGPPPAGLRQPPQQGVPSANAPSPPPSQSLSQDTVNTEQQGHAEEHAPAALGRPSVETASNATESPVAHRQVELARNSAEQGTIKVQLATGSPQETQDNSIAQITPLPNTVFSPVNPAAAKMPVPSPPPQEPKTVILDATSIPQRQVSTVSQVSAVDVPHPKQSTDASVPAPSSASVALSGGEASIGFSPDRQISPETNPQTSPVQMQIDVDKAQQSTQDDNIYDATPKTSPAPPRVIISAHEPLSPPPREPSPLAAEDRMVAAAPNTNSWAEEPTGGDSGTPKGFPGTTSQEIFEEHKRKIMQREQEEKIPLFPDEPDPSEMKKKKEAEESAPMMSATSYPGQEWNPYGDPGFEDWND